MEVGRGKNGIPVEDVTWDKLVALAAKYGMQEKLGL
jgi:LDH2 family malate/lactate/ureidoglycolate dehydrogenase